MTDKNQRFAARNKKAFHDYFVLETYEAGIELFGTEVKSIRQGRLNLKDSWCIIEKGEIFAHGVHISPYEQGNIFNREPLRPKKLLLHKREIMRLYGEFQKKGLAIIPLSVYFKRGKAKMSIGLCKGKKIYDKREDIAKKTMSREAERELREHQKN